MHSQDAASSSAVRLTSSASMSNQEPRASQIGSRTCKWSTAAFRGEAGKEKEELLFWSGGEGEEER